MGLTILSKTTNVRPPSTTELEISTSTTKGKMSFTSALCKALNLTADSRIVFHRAKDDAGKDVMAISIGHPGDEKNAPDGALLSYANDQDGGNMSCSSANTFDELGGKEKGMKQVYRVATELAETQNDVTYFPLMWVRQDEPQERKPAAPKADNGVQSDMPAETPKASKKGSKKEVVA